MERELSVVGQHMVGADCLCISAGGDRVLVTGVAPDDDVVIHIAEGSEPLRGALVRVVSRGPRYRDPPCVHAARGECRGCPWQHLTDEAQQGEKHRQVAAAVAAIAPEAIVPATLAPVPPFGYRRRARLGHKTSGRFGYFRKDAGTYTLFQIEECPILAPPLRAALHGQIRDHVAAFDHNPDGRHYSLDIAVDPQNGEVVIGPRAGVFRQAAAESEQALVDLVLRALPAAPAVVCELFAGAGTFTRPMVERGYDVTAWECAGAAVAALREAVPGVRAAHCADLLGTEGVALGAADAVVLDPARAGISERLVRDIDATRATTVIYISCNPETLCRDLALFHSLADSFSVEWVQPLDAFPQTFHIECVARLTRLRT